MNKFKLFRSLILFLLVSVAAFSSSIDIYYGPEGGFCETNNSRMLEFADGTLKRACLANALLHRIDHLENKSTVKIAMYSMSDYDSLEFMIEAAMNRGIKFKLLLDGAAPWSENSRNKVAQLVREAREEAWANDKDFNFQVAFVTPEAMRRNGREHVLEDGRLIWGTMHEKFGIFYSPDSPVPHSAFNGSANISKNSSEIYAENRVFFDNQPVVARLFQEQFARYWNEYSVGVVGPITPEKHIVAENVAGYARVLFNSRPVDEIHLTRIDSELLNMISRVEENGSLDLAMFSFTRVELAEQILRMAELRPNARFRLLLDHSQLDDSNPAAMRQAPGLEAEAKKRGLENIEVRYRFRHNAYAYNNRENKPDLLSFLSLFWHHKNMTVNDNEMVIGSYNWSFSAEFLNYENVMFFDSRFRDHDKIISSFKNEFDVMFNSSIPKEAPTRPRRGEPQTVTLQEGQRLHSRLLKLLETPINHMVLSTMDWQRFKTFEEIKEETGLGSKEVRKALRALINHNMVVKWERRGVIGYSQAD